MGMGTCVRDAGEASGSKRADQSRLASGHTASPDRRRCGSQQRTHQHDHQGPRTPAPPASTEHCRPERLRPALCRWNDRLSRHSGWGSSMAMAGITISPQRIPSICLVGTQALMTQLAAFLGHELDGFRPAVVRCRADSDTLWTVRVRGDRARQLAELWLDCGIVSLEAKRERLRVAAKYVSRATRARIAPRRRQCDWCGAPVERMPSQLGQHVFCSLAHFGKWNAARRGWSGIRPTAQQLQFSLPGL
jgi:hypothetical protein